jgi:hypothetical protein
MEVERIRFERTGGFAGIRLAADFNLGELPEEQVHTLTDLLDELDFAELPDHLSYDSSASDEFTYTITVEAEEWKHTVVTGDSPADEKMQELLQLLNRLLRSQRKKQ